MAQWSRICLPTQETQVQSLGLEDPLEKQMATYSSTLSWRIPWTEEPGGSQFMGLQRVRRDLASKQFYSTWLVKIADRPNLSPHKSISHSGLFVVALLIAALEKQQQKNG